MIDDAGTLRERLNDRLEEVLSHFWPGWVRKGKCAYPAAVSKDNHGSFEVYLENGLRQRGQWFRNSEGIGGDELNLFAYGLTGRTRATGEVFRKARQFLGEPRVRLERPSHNPARRQSPPAPQPSRAAPAGRIWRAAQPVSGTIAEVYLNCRGIPTPAEGWPDTLRYERALYHPETHGLLPALIGRVDNADGNPTGIWRIYLKPDGRGKASVTNAKLGLGPVAGGAVRLGGIGPHIGLCEGIETALGAWFLTGRKFPVWAALSTSGLINFNVPEGVARVTCFPDGDKPLRRKDGEHVPSEPPGRAAARKLQERLHQQSIPCAIASEPPGGADYLDLWVEAQKESAA